jgi:hypothetical protein
VVYETCYFEEPEGQIIIDRVFAVEEPGRARTLITLLLNAVQECRDRSQALGRLCYFLRRLEQDAKKRSQLSGMFSMLRLFPKLHDLRAWNTSRHRREMCLRLKPGTPIETLAQLVRAAGAHSTPMAFVRSIGPEIAKCIDLGDQETLLSQPDTRVCFVSTCEELLAPIEWAVVERLEAPLSRARVVFRRIENLGYALRREALEAAFHKGATGPPRILLFGYDTASLQDVTTELRALQTLLTERYKLQGWPTELIHCVVSHEASRDRLEMELAGGDYDIVHLAGEGGFDAGQSIIQVADHRGHALTVTGEEIGEWLRMSSVRLVYLSCCEGAAPDMSSDHWSGWRQSLCKEILEAGVPEVLAHIWPVSDARSVAFSRTFYSNYFPAFDAPLAIHKARTESGRSNELWASSVLIQQAAS